MLDLLHVFGDNIKHYRTLKNISQGDFAEKTGIGQARLSRIENGKVEAGLSTIATIAEGLNVSPAELLIDGSNKDTSFEERLLQIKMLSEYDQKLVGAILESLLEKSRLSKLQEVKMKQRLSELEKMKGRVK